MSSSLCPSIVWGHIVVNNVCENPLCSAEELCPFFQVAVLFDMEFPQVPSVRPIVCIENKYIVGVEIVRVRGEDCW